jgi:KUP system potassium uptake protein
VRIGVCLSERDGPDALDKLIDDLRRAADDGFASAWMSNIFGLDALTALAVAGSRVPGIALGTAVVPTYPRHPAALAQQARTVALATRAQRVGTAKVGRLFGPVMTAWFVAIGATGVAGIAKEPGILRALSPTYAAAFLVGRFEIAFFALAAVVLAVTGAEALNADLGHFGRVPIARAWLLLVFPACVLSYFGQGALILADGGDPQGAVRAPFFLLVPSWALVPLVVLATAATVIASQAVITGAFSVARQAVQLGYLPRLRIVHTSAQTIGQIYVPYVNWALLVMVIVLVLSFRTSAALAYAFGMAVTGTILITTLLIFYVAWRQWGWPLWVVVPVGGAVLGFEALLLAANLTKIPSGAWLRLVIAVVVLRGGVGTDGSPAPGSATPATTTATTSCSRACAGPADHPV